VRICFAKPNSVEPDSLVSETGGSRISKTSDETSKTTMAGLDDWRTPLVPLVAILLIGKFSGKL
jgi:hypothetical protein